MTWYGRKVLITGGAGFVASHLMRALYAIDATPIGLDRVATSPSLRALFGSIVRPVVMIGDVTDLHAMMSLIAQVRPDILYHLAGQGHIKDAQDNPWPAFWVNVMGTIAILEAVRQVKPDTILVCASSNHAYIGGFQRQLATQERERETHALRATDTYGASKAMADRAVACYRSSFGLRAVAVRHVNSYGPADPHATHLVTASILSCLAGTPPELRGQGTGLKGYLHVRDVCAAYLTIAEHIDNIPGHAVNVTVPECEASVLEIMQIVCGVAGIDPARVQQNEQVSDQEGYEERLDGGQIALLGWRPQFTLHTGIAETFAWYQAHQGMAWLAS